MRTNDYIPGVCNIGQTEIKERKLYGWIGFGLSLVLAVLFLVFDVAKFWRLSLFFTVSLAVIGYLQAKWHFCARFGLNGVFNFSADAGKTDTVDQAEFRRQDQKKALQIIGLSVLSGTAVAIVFYFLPL